jgi:hypothetical protein
MSAIGRKQTLRDPTPALTRGLAFAVMALIIPLAQPTADLSVARNRKFIRIELQDRGKRAFHLQIKSVVRRFVEAQLNAPRTQAQRAPH